jgi:hypothetical protein
MANYTVAGDVQDSALFSAQFADDGILENAGYRNTPGFKLQGRDAIRGMVESFKTPPAGIRLPTFVRHNLTTCHIQVTGNETATARTYFTVFSDIGPDHVGVYTDTLVRKGTQWLFAHRRITMDWAADNSFFFPK